MGPTNDTTRTDTLFLSVLCNPLYLKIPWRSSSIRLLAVYDYVRCSMLLADAHSFVLLVHYIVMKRRISFAFTRFQIVGKSDLHNRSLCFLGYGGCVYPSGASWRRRIVILSSKPRSCVVWQMPWVLILVLYFTAVAKSTEIQSYMV